MMYRWILSIVLLGVVCAYGNPIVLPEGFVLNGMDGLAVSEPNGWTFTADGDMVYLKTTLPAGSVLPVLPSSGLDQIRSYAAKDQQKTRVKIWGILTSYNKKNFLFPIQVIALSVTDTKPSEPLPTHRIEPNAVDPAVSDVIPSEVMKILRSQSKVDLAKMSEVMDSGSSIDFSLIGKTGYITTDEDKLFVPDSFGRKIERGRLALLPCLTLEETEKELTRSLGQYRYTISGIVTTCSGKQYILPYRAVRTYSNGNFTP